jgi:hypothetical protein
VVVQVTGRLKEVPSDGTSCWDPLGTNDEIAPTLVPPIKAPTTGMPMKITSHMAKIYP